VDEGDGGFAGGQLSCSSSACPLLLLYKLFAAFSSSPDRPWRRGRGGEGGQGDAASVRVGGGVWKPQEIQLLTAISLRRPLPTAANHGHRVGLAALDDDVEVASLFFLCERIFCSVAAATKPPAQPSGLVPGWNWGDAVVTPQAASECFGLDRVCEVLFRVQCVKSRGHVVFFFVSAGPLCKSVPTAGMNLLVLLDLNRSKK
jgi:hypothetical protein